MVELWRGIGWEKSNRINFYWVLILMYTIWKDFNACYNSKIFGNSSSFFSFLILVQYLFKQYIIASCVLLISLNQHILILFVNNIDIGNISLPKKWYIKLDIVQNLYEFYQFYLSDFLSLKYFNNPKSKNIPLVKICPNGQIVLILPICILLKVKEKKWKLCNYKSLNS